MRVFIIFFVSFVLLIFTSIHIFAAGENLDAQVYTEKGSLIQLPVFDSEAIQNANVRKEKERQELAEKQRQRESREGHIAGINTYLSTKKSPIANTDVAGILYDSAMEADTDYRILLALIGVESGFCAQDYYFNCFGYLNGAKYSSFEQAFKDITPKVAKEYAARYGTNFAALAQAYGIVNWQKGAHNLNLYYSQIEL